MCVFACTKAISMVNITLREILAYSGKVLLLIGEVLAA